LVTQIPYLISQIQASRPYRQIFVARLRDYFVFARLRDCTKVNLRDCAIFFLLGCVITLCLQGCVIAQWPGYLALLRNTNTENLRHIVTFHRTGPNVEEEEEQQSDH
jgi:hypothetical protein